MKPTRNVRIGKTCKKHPGINGLRYVGNNRCVECAKEESRKHYASLEMTPAQKITTLLGEIARLKIENEDLRKIDDRFKEATLFAQKLCDCAGAQPSVATGYLRDLLAIMTAGVRP